MSLLGDCLHRRVGIIRLYAIRSALCTRSLKRDRDADGGEMKDPPLEAAWDVYSVIVSTIIHLHHSTPRIRIDLIQLYTLPTTHPPPPSKYKQQQNDNNSNNSQRNSGIRQKPQCKSQNKNASTQAVNRNDPFLSPPTS